MNDKPTTMKNSSDDIQREFERIACEQGYDCRRYKNDFYYTDTTAAAWGWFQHGITYQAALTNQPTQNSAATLAMEEALGVGAINPQGVGEVVRDILIEAISVIIDYASEDQITREVLLSIDDDICEVDLARLRRAEKVIEDYREFKITQGRSSDYSCAAIPTRSCENIDAVADVLDEISSLMLTQNICEPEWESKLAACSNILYDVIGRDRVHLAERGSIAKHTAAITARVIKGVKP